MNMRIDYKPDSLARRGPSRVHWLTVCSGIATAVVLFIVSGNSTSGTAAAGYPVRHVEVELPIPEPAFDTTLPPADLDGEPHDNGDVTVTVRSGDSMAVIFNRLGLPAAELHRVMTSGAETGRLAHLRPGEELHFGRDGDGRLLTIGYALDEARTLRVIRDGEAFTSQLVIHPVERRITHAQGVIESSLFVAARDAGLSDNLTMRLAAIFGWDIDFVLDIRTGDSFNLLYEEVYRDGEKLRDGEILAAEFVNRGRSFHAVRFVDEDGVAEYYTPDGMSVRRAFLRAPLEFSRVSSRFNLRRRHPILHTIRAHRGVDYAAPTGTAVRASGDGRVVRRGPHGGYGNTVEIQHGGNISTLYAHLSRFQRGIGVGTRVRQGQVIGYVGMTGLASGPHLHYEFRVDGVHRNPLTVKLPNADPLPERYRDAYREYARPLLAHLEALGHGPRVAAASPAGSVIDDG